MTYIARRAIIIGPDSGPGHATALTLARAGFDIGLTWNRNEAGAHDTARDVRGLGRQASTSHLDPDDSRGTPRALRELSAALGGLDVFVRAAPFPTDRRTSVADDVRAAAREMRRRHQVGRIIVIADGTSHEGRNHRDGPGTPREPSMDFSRGTLQKSPPDFPPASLPDLVSTLAGDVAAGHITINAVAYAAAAQFADGFGTPWALRHSEGSELIPGRDRDIAALVEFLASPIAAYITGKSFMVSGGMLRVSDDGEADVAARGLATEAAVPRAVPAPRLAGAVS